MVAHTGSNPRPWGHRQHRWNVKNKVLRRTSMSIWHHDPLEGTVVQDRKTLNIIVRITCGCTSPMMFRGCSGGRGGAPWPLFWIQFGSELKDSYRNMRNGENGLHAQFSKRFNGFHIHWHCKKKPSAWIPPSRLKRLVLPQMGHSKVVSPHMQIH